MELNNINNKGAWSDIAASLNQNFLKILVELLKYQHVTTISGANFLGYFTSSSVLPNPAEAAWAVAGDLKAVTVYAYYTSDAVPSGFSAGWNALSSLGTYDFTDYSNLLTKVEETDAKVSELVQKVPLYSRFTHSEELTAYTGVNIPIDLLKKGSIITNRGVNITVRSIDNASDKITIKTGASVILEFDSKDVITGATAGLVDFDYNYNSSYADYISLKAKTDIIGLNDNVISQYGKNLYCELLTSGGRLDSVGNIQSSTLNLVTAYIKVKPNTSYILTNTSGDYPGGSNYYAYYDSDYKLIGVGNTKEIITPNNCSYIRCTIGSTQKDVMLEQGTERTEYEKGNPIHQYLADVYIHIEDYEGKVVSIEDKIGEKSTEYTLHLNTGAYEDTKNLSIKKGSVILSFGDYSGKLLLCPLESFSSSNYVSISASNLPYITEFEVKTIRSNSAIDSDITIKSQSSGIYAEIESLARDTAILPNYATIKGNMVDGTIFELEKNSVKSNNSFSFSAQLGTFTKIRIGRGKPTEKLYSSGWVEVDSENINIVTYFSDSQTTTQTYAHGLTFENNIQILLSMLVEDKIDVTVVSNGKSFTQRSDWKGFNGTLFAESIGSTLNNARFSWTCKKLSSNIWLFGDSYFGTTSELRWTYYMLKNGYKDVLINGFAGAGCASAYSDVITLLQHNTPKYIVWCMGMNNKDTESSVNTEWNSTFSALKDLCESYGIELILSTIPTVKGGYVEDTNEYSMRIHKFKNAIVRSSGLRYIDFDKAVGANEETGEWYGDMLYTDGVHPAADGARALFMQAIADFPELMSSEDY